MPIATEVFSHGQYFFDALRGYAIPPRDDLPMQQFVMPSIAKALTREAKIQLHEFESRQAVGLVVKALTPAFRLSGKMRLQANFLCEPPLMTLSIDGETREQERYYATRIIPFRNPHFPLTSHPENKRHDVLLEEATLIGLRIILTPQSVNVTTDTRLELQENGPFLYAYTRFIGEGPDQEEIAGAVADCVMWATSAVLRKKFGAPHSVLPLKPK